MQKTVNGREQKREKTIEVKKMNHDSFHFFPATRYNRENTRDVDVGISVRRNAVRPYTVRKHTDLKWE